MERNFNTLGSSISYEDVEWETLLPLDIDDHDHNDFIDDESGVAVPMLMPVPAPIRSSESDDDHEIAKDQRQPLMMIRKGQWTSQEDSKLSACVALYGQGCWNSLARLAGLNRSGKSCRLRWLNYLSPDLRHDNFTLEEQLNILQLHLCFGKRWSKIAQHLPGRTDNQIKNYWRTKVQRLAKHLKCDVNSPQFNNALIHTWIPTLKERIEAGSRSNSIITQSHIGPNTDQSPIHCCGNEPMDCYTEPNCSDFRSLSHNSWAPYWYVNGPTGLISEPSICLKPYEAHDSVNLDQSANNLGYNLTWNQSPNNMSGTLAYDEDNMLPPAHHCAFYSSEHIYHHMA